MHLLSCFEFAAIDQFRFESFEKLSATALSQQFPFCSYFVLILRISRDLQFVYRHIGCPGQNEVSFLQQRSVPVGHPNGRVYGMGCLQILCQPGTSIVSFSCKICISDLFVQLHSISFSLSLPIFKPVVITASGYLQYFTHHLDRPLFRVVFLHKEKDQRFLLEMMLKAFNMSRSVSTSPDVFRSAIFLESSLSDRTPCPGKPAFLSAGTLSANDIKERGNTQFLCKLGNILALN